ncbi:hypothetical protein MYX06_03015 [Patescibacteria group bacterium AH-259-L05]|nr:hypothetical protein [Patescibacteria group bacterium AH-259-L05]
MGEGFKKEYGLPTEKDIKFFNGLVEKYKERGVDIDSSADYIIIIRESGRIHNIPKWYVIPQKNNPKGGMDIEEYIDMILAEDEE